MENPALADFRKKIGGRIERRKTESKYLAAITDLGEIDMDTMEMWERLTRAVHSITQLDLNAPVETLKEQMNGIRSILWYIKFDNKAVRRKSRDKKSNYAFLQYIDSINPLSYVAMALNQEDVHEYFKQLHRIIAERQILDPS